MTDEELKKEIDTFVFRELSGDFKALEALYVNFIWELSFFLCSKR